MNLYLAKCSLAIAFLLHRTTLALAIARNQRVG